MDLRRENEKETAHLFEKIMAENFPNLRKEVDTQIHEVQRVPTKVNPKGPTHT